MSHGAPGDPNRSGGRQIRKRSDAGARARAFAALAVNRVLADGKTLDQAFDEVLNGDLPERERSQIKALAFGALRWHHRHRLIIGELLARPLRSRDRVLEALLSVGVYELIDARQPGYAAVSAAVDASRQLKRPRASGLINAALRRFLREESELLRRALADEEGRYVHPRWLIDRVRADWPDHWGTALTAALEHPPMWLRVNRARTTRAEYAERLRNKAGVTSLAPAAFPDALLPERALPVAELPGFDDGLVSVQDAAAQLAPHILGAESGMRVLDACAAPGGKATHILERVAGELELVAVDVDPARNTRLEAGLRRAGFTAQVITADVMDVASWAGKQRYDRILVDAPCSATGVIRRHPDIKFLRRADDIAALARRQHDMLASLWELLAPGGRLLYATCSILREENHAVITRFKEAHPDALEIVPDVPGAVESAGPGVQLLPGGANTDGFYYALMERKE